MKKFICLIILLSITSLLIGQNFDYTEALQKSINFYDGNKCGKDVVDGNVFSWRDNCHTRDGADIGHDFTGGFHDAGDHVKFGLPQGYTAAILGWIYYEYEDVLSGIGMKNKMLSNLKHFTDYFIKCNIDENTFYYQIADGNVDHNYWGNPSLQDENRKSYYYASPSTPASDVCGITAAALALMYINYKEIDSNYADQCLNTAKNLYNLGKNYKGLSSSQTFYQSNSYWDDLIMGALWLYIAENNTNYLDDIDSFYASSNGVPFTNWTLCWNDVNLAGLVKLAEVTNNSKYHEAIDYNLNHWINSITTTPGGLKHLSNWGVLRYTANASFIAMKYHEMTGEAKYKDLALSQIDYILGDNPMNMSYMIGFGSNWPLQPHHKAAQGYEGWMNWLKPAKNLLEGALVGGPDQSDNYTDDIQQYLYTEVSIYYNAGLIGALAGIVKSIGQYPTPTPSVPVSTPTSTPTATPTPTMTPTPTSILVNIALNKPVTASSKYSQSFPAVNIVDGNKQTVWGSRTGNTSEWFFVDLGVKQEINGIGLFWFGEFYAREYSLWSSDDGTNWTKLITLSKSSAGADIFTDNISLNLRYLAVLCTKKNNVAYGLGEFEIYQSTP